MDLLPAQGQLHLYPLAPSPPPTLKPSLPYSRPLGTGPRVVVQHSGGQFTPHPDPSPCTNFQHSRKGDVKTTSTPPFTQAKAHWKMAFRLIDSKTGDRQPNSIMGLLLNELGEYQSPFSAPLKKIAQLSFKPCSVT